MLTPVARAAHPRRGARGTSISTIRAGNGGQTMTWEAREGAGNPMAEPTQLLIVPHTHWDREWYQTFQQFRIRLVHTIDKLLDILERDSAFTTFMLDGQTIVLEDYLEARPESAERLQNLARAGRILVGPWYLQPDEFLVGGESLIRNLQIGVRIAEMFGGAMSVGYVPDLFGHIAQLPQILQGFGIDNAVLWRGIGPEIARSEFRWSAPDGTSVLCVWLADPLGYSNARDLPLETDLLLARVELIARSLRRRATTNTLLLMNGSDHLEPQEGLPAAIAKANERVRGAGQTLVIGALPQYIEAIKRAHPQLATFTGELRSSRYAHLLPGVLSTRMWIKQRNAACETLLTRWAEPFSAWAWLLGDPHPAGLLRLAWRHLLHNHPHDSICGTSIDQVHAEMRPRFDQSEQIGETLTRESLGALSARVDTQFAAALSTHGKSIPIVVFNPTPGPRSDVVTCPLELTAAPERVQVVDHTGQPVPHEIRHVRQHDLVTREVGRTMVATVLRIGLLREGRYMGYSLVDIQFIPQPDGRSERVVVTVSEHDEPDMAVVRAAIEHLHVALRDKQLTTFYVVVRTVTRAEVMFLAREVASFGAKTFVMRKRHDDEPAAPTQDELRTEPGAIENAFYRVEVHPSTGTLTILDKTTDTRYTGLNRFEDGGDVGDLYNYSPPRDDVIVAHPQHPPEVALVGAGPAQATLRISLRYALPARATQDRQARHDETVECPIITEVSLAPGVPRVDIRTRVENHARDHRLRAVFPAPLRTEVSQAEDTFTVVRRPIHQPRPGLGDTPWSQWAELPVDTHPQKRFVDVSDGRIGLAVLNRGLPEYEALPWPANGGVAVALTLLRCVEWLSRDDLRTRRGHAGPMEHTPEAQLLGAHVFEYALVPHAGAWDAGAAAPLVEAQAFEAPLRAQVTGIHPGPLPAAWSFVTVSPQTVVVSAVKRAEREDALALRVYNPTERAVEAEVRVLFPFREARLVNLNEADLPAAEVATHHVAQREDQGMRLALRGGEIATLLLRF
jgi:alpha-mannosidase